MYYIDTSVLLAYTLTRKMEPTRYTATATLFRLVDQRIIEAVTSFYALHELLTIALTNTAPDWKTGSELARRAMLTILQTKMLYLPLPSRENKIRYARRFSDLRDATDLPHAVAAYGANCTTIIAYDEHFRAITHLLAYHTPDEVIAELNLSS